MSNDKAQGPKDKEPKEPKDKKPKKNQDAETPARLWAGVDRK